MRTEADLREAFRALEDAADSYGTPRFDIRTVELQTAPTAPRGSRMRVVVSSLAAAAAVIVALVIAAVVSHAPGSSGHRPAATTGPSPSPTPTTAAPTTAVPSAPRTFDLHELWFSVRPMNGVTISGYKLFADTQQVQLDTNDGNHWDVTLSASSATQPSSLGGAEPVTIGGRQGFYGELAGLAYATPADKPVGLVWQYAPGAWATVVSADASAISSDDATRVAEAVVPGRAQAVRSPLEVQTAPPGTQLEGFVGGPGGSRATQRGTEGVNALVDFTTGTGTAFTVDFAPRLRNETYTGTPTTVAGRTAYVSPGSITILVDKNYVAHLGTTPSGPTLSAQQLLTVARSCSFAANPLDQGTWFDARVALP